MCIAALVWLTHPIYPLILLDNRDEYHHRPTKAVEWWNDNEILGGRDEVAGGTWLACSRIGRIALLTNVLELQTNPDAKSRGHLASRFLQGRKNPKEFAEEISKEANEYNGFNLIVADVSLRTMFYVSNRHEHGQFDVRVQEVSSGIHVLSNAMLDSPWPKAIRLSERLTKMLSQTGDDEELNLKEMVEKLLKDAAKAEDVKDLPGICSSEWEHALSSIFVKVETPLGIYGTRSMTAMSVGRSGEVRFYEKYIEDEAWKEKCIGFQIK